MKRDSQATSWGSTADAQTEAGEGGEWGFLGWKGDRMSIVKHTLTIQMNPENMLNE